MKLFGIMGWKNTGKTGLTTRLITHFTAQGLSVATLKRTHHGVDLEQEGTDTHRHRMSGAGQVMLVTDHRLTLMTELAAPKTPQDLAARLDPVDLVLAEGWKRGSHLRLETTRKAAGTALIARDDPSICAIASDFPLDGVSQPVFDLDDTQAIAGFILRQVNL